MLRSLGRQTAIVLHQQQPRRLSIIITNHKHKFVEKGFDARQGGCCYFANKAESKLNFEKNINKFNNNESDDDNVEQQLEKVSI